MSAPQRPINTMTFEAIAKKPKIFDKTKNMGHRAIYLAGAIASFAAAIALIVYGVWFYRKMKRLRIIT